MTDPAKLIAQTSAAMPPRGTSDPTPAPDEFAPTRADPREHAGKVYAGRCVDDAPHESGHPDLEQKGPT